MDIKKQVCSVEQAIKLRQLGILQDNSQFMYVKQQETDQWELVWVGASYEWTEHPNYSRFTFSVNTYTVAELGVMLGFRSLKIHPIEENLNEAKERADDLIHLLTIGELMVESVNERLAS